MPINAQTLKVCNLKDKNGQKVVCNSWCDMTTHGTDTKYSWKKALTKKTMIEAAVFE